MTNLRGKNEPGMFCLEVYKPDDTLTGFGRCAVFPDERGIKVLNKRDCYSWLAAFVCFNLLRRKLSIDKTGVYDGVIQAEDALIFRAYQVGRGMYYAYADMYGWLDHVE